MQPFRVLDSPLDCISNSAELQSLRTKGSLSTTLTSDGRWNTLVQPLGIQTSKPTLGPLVTLWSHQRSKLVPAGLTLFMALTLSLMAPKGPMSQAFQVWQERR